MPAMKDKLRPTEVVRLVTFVRNFRGGEQVVADEQDEQEEQEEEEEEQEEPSTPPGPRTLAEATPPAVRPDATPALFQRLCSACHGADGRGSAARAQLPALPDFSTPDWHQRRSDAQLEASVLNGKGTAMPAFSGKLDEAQARELVAYLRSLVPAGVRAIPTKSSSNFRRRYQELQDEMNELKRQYRALSGH